MGQLGDGTYEDKKNPTRVGTDTDWIYVETTGHTCGIKKDHTLWCWGNNTYGQLGTGDYEFRENPAQVFYYP